MTTKFPSAYLLAGDAYLAETKLQAVLKDFQKAYPGELHIPSYRLSETPLEVILTESHTLPFYAAAQAIRVRDAEELKEAKAELIESYLKNPPPATLILFEAADIPRDHFLVKLVLKLGEVHYADGAQDRKSGAERLIREKLRGAGKSLAPDALVRLEEIAQEAPAFLEALLDQLVTYSGAGETVTAAMIENFEQDAAKIDVFTLTDAIAAKKTPRALTLLERLLEDGDRDIISFLGLLHWQFKRFWLAKVGMEDGEPEAGLLRKCKVSPKQAPFFLRQLKLFTRKKLERSLEELFQIDWKIKTGQADGPLALEKWVIETTAA